MLLISTYHQPAMNKITKYKFVCIHRDYINDKILTIDKIYEVTKEEANDPFINITITQFSFIGDDGNYYLIDNNDKDFITLEEWRERKLNKIINKFN